MLNSGAPRGSKSRRRFYTTSVLGIGNYISRHTHSVLPERYGSYESAYTKTYEEFFTSMMLDTSISVNKQGRKAVMIVDPHELEPRYGSSHSNNTASSNRSTTPHGDTGANSTSPGPLYWQDDFHENEGHLLTATPRLAKNMTPSVKRTFCDSSLLVPSLYESPVDSISGKLRGKDVHLNSKCARKKHYYPPETPDGGLSAGETSFAEVATCDPINLRAPESQSSGTNLSGCECKRNSPGFISMKRSPIRYHYVVDDSLMDQSSPVHRASIGRMLYHNRDPRPSAINRPASLLSYCRSSNTSFESQEFDRSLSNCTNERRLSNEPLVPYGSALSMDSSSGPQVTLEVTHYQTDVPNPKPPRSLRKSPGRRASTFKHKGTKVMKQKPLCLKRKSNTGVLQPTKSNVPPKRRLMCGKYTKDLRASFATSAPAQQKKASNKALTTQCRSSLNAIKSRVSGSNPFFVTIKYKTEPRNSESLVKGTCLNSDSKKKSNINLCERLTRSKMEMEGRLVEDVKKEKNSETVSKMKKPSPLNREKKRASNQDSAPIHILREFPNYDYTKQKVSASWPSGRGCWTCRIRHKSCPNDTIVCSSCERLKLFCDRSAVRPSYMESKDSMRKVRREIREITDSSRRVKKSSSGK